MINESILQYVDYSFLIFVAIFALLTPRESEYNRINKLIVGMFCIFIGLTETQLYLEIEESWITCLINALLSFRFAYMFWPTCKTHFLCNELGQYISFLCVSMGVFHIGNMFYGYTDLWYAVIVICFQILLLMAASWGVIDGNSNRVNRWYRVVSTWFSTHFNSH